MFHHLRRNPFGLKGHLTRMLVVAYAFPKEILQPLLPLGLTVDTYKGYGFAAVALTQVKDMRPALLPAWMGMNPFLAGFRIFTRFQVPNGPNLRGLYILKSISGTRWFCRAGNLLTHYRYELGTPTWEADAKTWRMEIASPKPELGVRIRVRVDELEPALPKDSPFETWPEARRFAGPLPFTFDYEPQSNSMLVVDGVRDHWDPRPVAVDSAEINFFKTELFKGCTPRLANAFVLEDIPYEWRKGRLIALGERTAQEVCHGELTLEMPHRAPYQGLALIMRLHWPVYVFGTGAALFVATLAKWMDLHPLVSGAIWAGAAFGILWMCVSLGVSYYVYDHSRMYDWAWLPKILPRFPRRWVNLHAGLDELSPALPVLFPNAQGQVIDMFHPDEMTEPSIRRAREVNGRPVTGQLRTFPQLPLGDETRDTAVLFMVAHEMRRPETRVAFFKELHRVLEKRGTVLVVEHLRNAWNFAAFGPPGYFHFLADAEWKRAGNEAGFKLKKEEMLTPFVKAFVFEKN